MLTVRDRGGRIGKYWSLRYRSPVTGLDREVGLGSFPKVGLEAARKLAESLRNEIESGKDPLIKIEPSTGSGPATFGEVAQACIRKNAPAWKSAKTEAAWRSSISTYCKPIENIPVGEVTRQHVASVLSDIWLQKPELSHKLRQRIEVVLNFAVARGDLPDDRVNPAASNARLLDLLPKKISRSDRVAHHPALAWKALPAFMVDLGERPALAARMLEVLILTASRSHMVRGALWSEFNSDLTVWSIPAARMKEPRSHRIPLSPEVVKILEALPVSGKLVFAQDGETEPSINSMRALLLRMDRADITAHGFRSTFADWATESGRPSEPTEAALAHRLPAVAGAYRRSDLFEQRKPLMSAWAEFALSERNKNV